MFTFYFVAVSNNEAAQEYTITINFENAANTKCGCTGLLNNAFYRVEWEQRGNYTTQATTQVFIFIIIIIIIMMED